MDNTEALSQFIAITGAEEEIARNLLEACGNNVDTAVITFFESNMQNGASSSSRNNSNQQSSAPMLADDNVRAPIAPIREVLVEDYPNFGVSGGSSRRPYRFDSHRDFAQETRWQEEYMRDEEESESENANASSRRRFDDLFRPPMDLMFRGMFAQAKAEGELRNKWLLVNIQDFKVFASQVLNRDVWSNETMKSIVRSSFIFWQAHSNDTQGEEFSSFYHVHQYPFIAIIDPRTGEKMRQLNATDPMTLCEDLTHFLVNHPSPNGEIVIEDDDPPPRIYNEEEEALNAAIAASLQEMEPEAPAEPEEDWKDFLGPEDGKKVEILIRYPDGTRENSAFPSGSKLKALILYISTKGYNSSKYDLYRNFPKKNLSAEMDDSSTIEEAGIHPRDTLFIQEKDD